MEFGMTAVVLIILAVLVTYSLEKKNFKKKLRMKLRTEYGQKPNTDVELPDYKETANYYNLIRDNIPEDEPAQGSSFFLRGCTVSRGIEGFSKDWNARSVILTAIQMSAWKRRFCCGNSKRSQLTIIFRNI